MAKYAIIGTGSIVTNIIVADSLEEASVLGFAVELTADNPGGIGYEYDAKTNVFTLPVQEESNA